ncbi:Sps19p [Sugiyamaella lignohabitans]|uniref:Sps19p n=1 Tax=Sugiyamaella lignohabitans TaxID=796027 RepID=A0A167D1Y7_9ASCO|nr:Sps19p [Sugiyamaella lignohabitans]ANB12379.1 Sps19p [Sugiyamaella lignohabitans]
MSSVFSLKGKVALVTGGTRGIGATMATALAEHGADVVLVQRDTTNDSTKLAIEKLGCKAHIITADLSDKEDVSTIVKRTLEVVPTIDILLNCAGIQRRHKAEQFPDNDWDEVIQVNLSTVFRLARDVGAHYLTKQPDSAGVRGKIINVASLLTYQGGITVPAYAASKGGVGQLTKALSNEWASKGINVNAIAPGYINTDMNEALIADPTRSRQILERIPANRWGKPEDFIGPVVFLASNASNYVSGEILVVDGGWMGR